MELDLTVADLLDRLKEKCSTQDLVSLGFPPSTISTWKSKNTFPRADDLYKISQYVGCTMEYLMTGTKIDDDYIFLSQKEQHLLNTYKKLPDAQKRALEVVLDALGKANAH